MATKDSREIKMLLNIALRLDKINLKTKDNSTQNFLDNARSNVWKAINSWREFRLTADEQEAIYQYKEEKHYSKLANDE